MDTSSSTYSLLSFGSGDGTGTETTRSTGSNHGFSPSPCDLGEPLSVEQDAMNEVQGLLVGLELLNEVEGHEDDNYPFDLEPDNSRNLPFINFEPSDVSVSRSPDDSIVWNHLSEKFCGIYGYPPDRPQNLKAFLRKLRPSQRGWIECPSCIQYRHGEFAPEVHEIKGHFRFYHLKEIKWADVSDWKVEIRVAIDCLMEDIQARELVLELLDQCSRNRGQYQELMAVKNACRRDAAYYKTNLPSIDLFLLRLRITCNGQLMCDQPRCADLRKFEASPEALKSHFVEHHCRHLYDDDQLVKFRIECSVSSGVEHYETAETVTRIVKKGVAQKKRWMFMDENDQRGAKEFDSQQKRRRASLYQNFYRTRQWGVLRDLRKRFYERHREFQKLATYAEPATQLFAKRCRRPGGLLGLGIVTFRKILRGHAPKTLFEVFAFISLSYAMAAVMRSRGIQVEFSPSISDFSSWKKSITDIDEQLTFDQLVVSVWHPDRLIWQLHARKLNNYSVQQTLDMLADKGPQSNNSPQTSMKEAIMQLIKAGSTDEAFNFSAFIHVNRLPIPDRCNSQYPAQQDTGCSNNSSHWDTSPGENKTSNQKCITAESLRATLLFTITQLFMIFIAQFGVMLIYFGNEEQHCQLSTVNSRSATAQEIMEAGDGMRSTMLNPLLADEKFSAIRYLFVAMDEVLELGLIWNVLDLSCYMITAAVHLVGDWHLRSLLCEDIRRRCLGEHDLTSLGHEKRSAEDPSQRSVKRHRNMEEIEEMEDMPTSNDSLLLQQKSSSQGAERSVCDDCGKTYNGPNSLNSLGRHRRERHLDSSWHCPEPGCNHYSKRRHNLHDHLKRKHGSHVHTRPAEVPASFDLQS